MLTWQFGGFFFLFFYSSVDATKCADRLPNCGQVQHLCDQPESGVREDCLCTCGLCTSEDDRRCPSWLSFANCTSDASSEKRRRCLRLCDWCQPVELQPAMRMTSLARHRSPRSGPSSSHHSDRPSSHPGSPPRAPSHPPGRGLVRSPRRSSSPHSPLGRAHGRARSRSPVNRKRPRAQSLDRDADLRPPKQVRYRGYQNPVYHPSRRGQNQPEGAGSSSAHNSSSDSSKKKNPFFAERLDQSVNPCNDFYKFACGNYKGERMGPNGRLFLSLREEQLHRIKQQQMEMINRLRNGHTTSAEQKMKEFWKMCLENTATHRNRLRALWKLMQAISQRFPIFNNAAISNQFDFGSMLHEMSVATGVPFLYRLTVEEASRNKFEAFLRSPDLIVKTPAFYSNEQTAESNKGLLREYVHEIITRMAADQKISKPATVEADIREVLELDEQLALKLIEHQQLPVEKIHVFEVMAIVNSVEWKNYIDLDPLVPDQVKSHLWNKLEVRVNVESAIQAIDEVFTATKENNPRLLANYFFVRFILHQVPYLTEELIDLHHRFNQQVYETPIPTSLNVTCYSEVMRHFGSLADHLYVMRVLRAIRDDNIRSVMQDLNTAMHKMLENQTWMTDRVKEKAVKKLKHVRTVLRLEEEAKNLTTVLREYAGLELMDHDSYVEAIATVRIHRAHKIMMQLLGGEHVLVRHWPTTDVYTLNELRTNSIFLSTLLLQYPIYNYNQPRAMKYGLLGFLAARELTHAFDEQGSLNDETGAPNDWWDDKTRSDFAEKSRIFNLLYEFQMGPQTDISVNAERTNRENIADGGGIRIAFEACEPLQSIHEKKLKGYEYNPTQSFFISYASFFCNLYPQQVAEKIVTTSVYAPDSVRVNTVLSNYDEFAKAFKCPQGSIMNPKPKYSVWE